MAPVYPSGDRGAARDIETTPRRERQIMDFWCNLEINDCLKKVSTYCRKRSNAVAGTLVPVGYGGLFVVFV